MKNKKRHKLSNGEEIDLPFHVYKGRHVMLIGTLNGEVAKKYLREMGLYEVKGRDGKAWGVVGAVEYFSSVAGPYRELYISFFGSTTPIEWQVVQWISIALSSNPSLRPICKMIGVPETMFVVWKMFVTTQTSLHAGRDLWGCLLLPLSYISL